MTEQNVTPLLLLAESLGFTMDDLRANRQAELSSVQCRRLWRRFFMAAAGAILLPIVPIVLAWLLIAWGTDDFSMTDQRALIGYVVGLLLGFIYVAANFKTLLLLRDLLRRRVATVKGPVRVWGQYLVIGHHRFVVETATLSLLQTGLSYRAFILPASSTLLSIEFAE